jgi:hypothetical protein
MITSQDALLGGEGLPEQPLGCGLLSPLSHLNGDRVSRDKGVGAVVAEVISWHLASPVPVTVGAASRPERDFLGLTSTNEKSG